MLSSEGFTYHHPDWGIPEGIHPLTYIDEHKWFTHVWGIGGTETITFTPGTVSNEGRAGFNAHCVIHLRRTQAARRFLEQRNSTPIPPFTTPYYIGSRGHETTVADAKKALRELAESETPWMNLVGIWTDHMFTMQILRQRDGSYTLIYVNRGARGANAPDFIESVTMFSFMAEEGELKINELIDALAGNLAERPLAVNAVLRSYSRNVVPVPQELTKSLQKNGICTAANRNYTWHFELACNLMQQDPSLTLDQAFARTRNDYKLMRLADRAYALIWLVRNYSSYTLDSFQALLVTALIKSNMRGRFFTGHSYNEELLETIMELDPRAYAKLLMRLKYCVAVIPLPRLYKERYEDLTPYDPSSWRKRIGFWETLRQSTRGWGFPGYQDHIFSLEELKIECSKAIIELRSLLEKEKLKPFIQFELNEFREKYLDAYRKARDRLGCISRFFYWLFGLHSMGLKVCSAIEELDEKSKRYPVAECDRQFNTQVLPLVRSLIYRNQNKTGSLTYGVCRPSSTDDCDFSMDSMLRRSHVLRT